MFFLLKKSQLVTKLHKVVVSNQNALYLHKSKLPTSYYKQWHDKRAFSSNAEDWPDVTSAWQIRDYGGVNSLSLARLKLQPIVKPTDVLVKVHAASVNPIDVMMSGGYGASTLNPLRKAQGSIVGGSEFPLTLGRDFSGVIVATGKGVPRTHFKPGDEVYGAGSAYRQGTHATHYIVDAQEIARKPKTLTHIEAASIPYVATTSWSALCTIGRLNERNCRDKRILITGASGGIGTFAIQLLKAWGAEVTVTCSQDATNQLVNLGADVVLDYKHENFQNDLQSVAGFDFIYNTLELNSINSTMRLLKKNQHATCVSISVPFLKNNDRLGLPFGLAKSILQLGKSSFQTLQEGKHYRWAVFIPNGTALQRVSLMVDRGKIKPVVEKVYSFEEMPAAFTYVQNKHSRGKTVVQIE